MEVGTKWYIISHAYYHYVGEIARVIGPKTVELRNVCQVHSCRRNWTEFFRDGFERDTQFDVMPDGIQVPIITAIPWNHDIPTKREK